MVFNADAAAVPRGRIGSGFLQQRFLRDQEDVHLELVNHIHVGKDRSEFVRRLGRGAPHALVVRGVHREAELELARDVVVCVATCPL